MLHILTNSYAVIDPLFGRPAGTFVEMDVGCGRGGFTLALAQRYPERLVLGTDVMLGRLRKIDAKAGKRGLQNLELLRASHTEMLGHQLPDSCIDRLHYLCPDPWPKSRHRAKRVASTDFFVRIARVVKPGGILHIATTTRPISISSMPAWDICRSSRPSRNRSPTSPICRPTSKNNGWPKAILYPTSPTGSSKRDEPRMDADKNEAAPELGDGDRFS